MLELLIAYTFYTNDVGLIWWFAFACIFIYSKA
jgi:hypothetical protein